MADGVDFGNPTALIRALNLPSQQSIAKQVRTLADLARAYLIKLAKERLKTTERDYVGGLQPVQMLTAFGSVTARIVLTGVLPNMVEHGWGEHDLRDTVLTSPKARISREGYRYMAIPFQHAWSGSGRNTPVVGQPYAAANDSPNEGQIMAGLIRGAARDAARKIEPSVSTIDSAGNRTTIWGGRVPESAGGPKLRDAHTTGLYTGMVRIQNAYAKAVQNRYQTFRMISENPRSRRTDDKGDNWHHPGIVPRRLFDEAQKYVERMAAEVMRAE